MYRVHIGKLESFDFDSITMEVNMTNKGYKKPEKMHCQLCTMHDVVGRSYAGAMRFKGSETVNCIQDWEVGTPCILIRKMTEAQSFFDTLDNFLNLHSMSDIILDNETGETFCSIQFNEEQVELVGDIYACRLVNS